MNTSKSLSLREIADTRRPVSAPPAIMQRKSTAAIHGGLLLGLGFVLAGSVLTVAARHQRPGDEVWSVDVPCAYSSKLIQGVSSTRGLLLDEGCQATTLSEGKYIPTLVFRRVEDGRVASSIAFRAWLGFLDTHKGRLYQDLHPKLTHNAAVMPAFYLDRSPNTALMMQVPWLAVVNLGNGSITRALLPSPDQVNSNSAALHIPLDEPVPMIVSVSPDRGTVAVASNIGSDPKVFVYEPDLTERIGSWSLPRYAEGIAWSPGGKQVAVLYDGKFDGKGKYVGEFPQWMPVRLSDVEIFEVENGTKVVSFFTGGPEAEIAFSPDGQLIYAISETSNVTSLQKNALREFSSRTGSLVRVIAPNGPRLHDDFALSPDGRFVAADASTARWHPFFTEPTPEIFGNVTRVFVLDTKTGKVIFSHIRRTGVAFPLNPIFTPDGRLLIVQYGPDRSAKGNQRDLVHIVAYSLAGP
jgi:WD40-like Beta Propeller Repeat